MDIQSDFYNYLAENMIDNTYNRFMIRRTEGTRRTFFDSDYYYVNGKNPLFVRINGAPRCEISPHVNPTENMTKIGMGQRLNTCFKVSERSSGRRRHMCVRNMRAQMRSEMICGSATLRQTISVLHVMCI